MAVNAKHGITKLVRIEEPGKINIQLSDPTWQVGQYVRVVAEAEDSSPEERARELDALLKAMQERAKSLGITEADGLAAIEEVRREKR